VSPGVAPRACDDEAMRTTPGKTFLLDAATQVAAYCFAAFAGVLIGLAFRNAARYVAPLMAGAAVILIGLAILTAMARAQRAEAERHLLAAIAADREGDQRESLADTARVAELEARIVSLTAQVDSLHEQAAKRTRSSLRDSYAVGVARRAARRQGRPVGARPQGRAMAARLHHHHLSAA